jgi:hypothetical protein
MLIAAKKEKYPNVDGSINDLITFCIIRCTKTKIIIFIHSHIVLGAPFIILILDLIIINITTFIIIILFLK